MGHDEASKPPKNKGADQRNYEGVGNNFKTVFLPTILARIRVMMSVVGRVAVGKAALSTTFLWYIATQCRMYYNIPEATK